MINEYVEIVREENTMKPMEPMKREESCCEIQKLSKKICFENLEKEVSEVKHELRNANTEESVNIALDKLSTLMDRLSKNGQVADVKEWVVDISEKIFEVKLHDVTRSALDDKIKKLLERAREIIVEERKKENANRLKVLFMELSKYSDELAELVDINQFFG